MGMGVEGQADIRMAEPLGDHLGRHARRQGRRRAGARAFLHSGSVRIRQEVQDQPVDGGVEPPVVEREVFGGFLLEPDAEGTWDRASSRNAALESAPTTVDGAACPAIISVRLSTPQPTSSQLACARTPKPSRNSATTWRRLQRPLN